MTLLELYNKNHYLTDKQERHGYLPFYDLLFEPYKDKKINILEIGYLDGGSLQMWEDYFQHASIRGIDITDEYRQKWGVTYKTGRVKTEIRDSNTLDAEYFKDFRPDIVIDDGSHNINDQLYTVKTIYPILSEGGLLIIEDFGSPEELLPHFRNLGIPFDVVDLRYINGHGDNMLLIYHK